MSGPTFEVFTLFPEAIAGFLHGGLIGKAAEQGLVAIHCTDFRDFTSDRHRTVDDAPYGGGPGMVMKIEPVVAALEAVTVARGPMHRILLTPSAPRFNQSVARRLATLPRIALLCGRYEGIDDRVREAHVDECLSLGDFVLNGGEVAALAIVEAVARLCEGVLGNPESAARDSFGAGEIVSAGTWLECPQYTRPPVFRGLAVPPVLLSGDHNAAERWRAERAWQRTWSLRPDLRPTRCLPGDTPIYLALAPGHGDLPAAAATLPGVAGRIATALALDPRGVRRSLKRRHGAAPNVVAVAPDPVETSLPVARTGAALLDLLALVGDLSAPLVLLLCPTQAVLGDLTHLSASGRERPQDPASWSSALQAVFALNVGDLDAAALELARSAPMIDSSPPQPVCGSAMSIAAAALSELRSPAAR